MKYAKIILIIVLIFISWYILSSIFVIRKVDYTSKYGYRITAPTDWKIERPRDLNPQIAKKLLNMNTEIVLSNEDGSSYCMIVPQKIANQDFTIEKLRESITNIMQSNNQEILESKLISFQGEDGFEIRYSNKAGMTGMTLCFVHNNAVIQATIVTSHLSDAEKIFNNIKENLKVVK